jgi:predicted Zn-dependent peptidase
VYTALPPYTRQQLDNGLDVYMIRYGTQEVVECQMVYRAGHAYESHPGLADFAGKMLLEGTARKTSLQIARLLDDYGSHLNVESGYELTTITLSTLERHLPLTLNLLKEVLTEATVPDAEFENARARSLQRLEVEHTKTQFHARKHFAQRVFGHQHPYAYTPTAEALQHLTAEACRSYLAGPLHPSRAFLIVSGLFDEADTLKLLNDKLGSLPALPPQEASSLAVRTAIQPAAPGLYHHAMAEGVQSSLRIGHLAVPRNHPDYNLLRLLNTLLGGYFGSRLMKNIREDKGYTYGIHSSWVGMKHAGYFVIGTDVGNEFVADTLREVQQELERLRQELISEQELEVAKNYLLGRIISQQETPFEVADTLKLLLHHGLAPDEPAQGFRQIQEATSAQLLALAQQHLQPQQLQCVVAGKVQVATT